MASPLPESDTKQTRGDKVDHVYKYIVIGGGIAGVTCAETLCSLEKDCVVLLLSASALLKAVTNFRKVTKRLEDFDIIERPMFEFHSECPNVTVVNTSVSRLIPADKIVYTSDGNSYKYEKLCICTGGTPKLIKESNPYVLGIRDTETVQIFQKRLEGAKKILVVGNGGIATEIVYEIESCDVVWAIKDDSITSTFIDSGAAQFFLPQLHEEKSQKALPIKRTKYTVDKVSLSDTLGSALGPDWHSGLDISGAGKASRSVSVVYKVEVQNLFTSDEFKTSEKCSICTDLQDWPVYVELTNGEIHGCDFVVSATGVVPNVKPFLEGNAFELSTDGGFNVNDHMQTSINDVYAAGDVCTTTWEPAPHWQQMRLWSQARQMGAYAAKCMVADSCDEEVVLDFCFELFAHVTKFFGYKVVLLGKYNAQGMKKEEYDLLLRVTKGKEYVKTVMKDGRMHGAILIGDTDLEETFENLILNQMDLSAFGEDLLDPNIDIEDYFD